MRNFEQYVPNLFRHHYEQYILDFSVMIEDFEHDELGHELKKKVMCRISMPINFEENKVLRNRLKNPVAPGRIDFSVRFQICLRWINLTLNPIESRQI